MNTFASGLKFGFLTGITNSICCSAGFGFGIRSPWSCGSFGIWGGFILVGLVDWDVVVLQYFRHIMADTIHMI